MSRPETGSARDRLRMRPWRLHRRRSRVAGLGASRGYTGLSRPSTAPSQGSPIPVFKTGFSDSPQEATKAWRPPASSTAAADAPRSVASFAACIIRCALRPPMPARASTAPLSPAGSRSVLPRAGHRPGASGSGCPMRYRAGLRHAPIPRHLPHCLRHPRRSRHHRQPDPFSRGCYPSHHRSLTATALSSRLRCLGARSATSATSSADSRST